VGFDEHSLDDTFQTIAFYDFVVNIHLEGISDGLLLLVDNVLELLGLCFHRFEFGHIVLDSELQELALLVFWDWGIRRIRTWDDIVQKRRSGVNVDDLGRSSLSKHNSKANVFPGLSIDKLDTELHKLAIWFAIDLETVERP
jgi:hypothetical protein